MDNEVATPRPFLDWYGIWPGHTGAGADELGVSQDPPTGELRLRVQPADITDPFIRPERDWETSMLMPFCVIREGDLLRMWYKTAGESGNAYIAYAESADGFDWKRPALGQQEYGGNRSNNLLHPASIFDFHSIFVDPSAPPPERYKGISTVSEITVDGVLRDDVHEGDFFDDLVTGMVDQGRGNEEIAERLELWHPYVTGAVSADGLAWRVMDAPLLHLVKAHLDTQNIAAYDAGKREYAVYLRGRQDDRRAVIKTGGPDFGGWPPPRFVFMADTLDAIDDDVYDSCYCRYPGTDLHLMFPSFYHRGSASLDIHLATSRDGDLWSRPERRPIIGRDQGPPNYMAVYAKPNLVALDDRKWGLMYCGTPVSHDIRRYPGCDRGAIMASFEYRWATWKRDRLVALEAPGEARFTLNATAQIGTPCLGRELRLNYRTEPGGWIRVGLAQPQTPYALVRPQLPHDGFSLAEADPLSGDDLSGVVSWKGKRDLSAFRGRPVSVAIHMNRAKLHSVSL